ncbi:MAG: FAD-dependent oxidoreductase, partial [Parasporobacterium sp.]|nr:FAD-dependent oxidoreductase [Parasporobacterium sp.]
MNGIIEERREIPVYDSCDILVVGGGAAGHAAALAAARAGAKNIILMERYGYMGGDATGGYVIMVPKLSWFDKLFVRGIQEEWFTRMQDIPGAVLAPDIDKIGWSDPIYVNQWKHIHDCVSRNDFEGVQEPNLVRSVYFEPNQLKIEMDKMLMEESDRIRVLYHSWGVRPIMDGNKVTGVFFESKEGR